MIRVRVSMHSGQAAGAVVRGRRASPVRRRSGRATSRPAGGSPSRSASRRRGTRGPGPSRSSRLSCRLRAQPPASACRWLMTIWSALTSPGAPSCLAGRSASACERARRACHRIAATGGARPAHALGAVAPVAAEGRDDDAPSSTAHARGARIVAPKRADRTRAQVTVHPSSPLPSDAHKVAGTRVTTQEFDGWVDGRS